jgi:carbon storage regulator
MLILTRRQEESLQIGPEVEVKVLRIRNGQVVIGVTAPKSIEVDRTEVFLRKQADQRCAGAK